MSLVNICLFFYVFWNCKTNTISDVNDTQRIEVILIPAYKLSYYKTNHFHPQPLYAINLFYIILWIYSLRRAPFTPLSRNTQRPRNPIRSFDKQSGLILIAVPWQSPARPDLNEILSRFGQIKCIPKSSWLPKTTSVLWDMRFLACVCVQITFQWHSKRSTPFPPTFCEQKTTMSNGGEYFVFAFTLHTLYTNNLRMKTKTDGSQKAI